MFFGFSRIRALVHAPNPPSRGGGGAFVDAEEKKSKIKIQRGSKTARQSYPTTLFFLFSHQHTVFVLFFSFRFLFRQNFSFKKKNHYFYGAGFWIQIVIIIQAVAVMLSLSGLILSSLYFCFSLL